MCVCCLADNRDDAGRYIPSYTFKENVDLSDPILSRFDLIAVLRDVVSQERNEGHPGSQREREMEGEALSVLGAICRRTPGAWYFRLEDERIRKYEGDAREGSAFRFSLGSSC